jgi:hypothetical protein
MHPFTCHLTNSVADKYTHIRTYIHAYVHDRDRDPAWLWCACDRDCDCDCNRDSTPMREYKLASFLKIDQVVLFHSYFQNCRLAHKNTHLCANIWYDTKMLYIHTYIQTYIHAYIHIYIHKSIYTYIHKYMHTYINTYFYSIIQWWHKNSIHTYIHIHIHIYIHKSIHTYISTCIHTCINTYIHTYTRVIIQDICKTIKNIRIKANTLITVLLL